MYSSLLCTGLEPTKTKCVLEFNLKDYTIEWRGQINLKQNQNTKLKFMNCFALHIEYCSTKTHNMVNHTNYWKCDKFQF